MSGKTERGKERFKSKPFSSLFPHSSMAKFISFLFLTTLLLSLQANARDSQFFSKVTPTLVNNNNNNNLKETQVPNNGVVNKPEQQPAFIPETENSYGLYGHESGLNPPSTSTSTTTPTNASPYTTTTTYQPYKTEEDSNKYNNNYYNFKKDAYNTNQNEMSETRLTGTSYPNNNYYNKDGFEGKQDELSDIKYTEGEYNSMEKQNNYDNNNNKYYYSNNAAPVNDRYFYNNNNNNNNAANQRYYKDDDAANYKFNGERQGLSDTRFMEGGKYYWGPNPTHYGGSSRGVNSQNWYNNKGYFGNNNVNSMEGYQNQEQFEDDQEEFEP
ncbi:hypothetical protein VNO77_04917 [Canavalia gladiata]|uniref:Protein E6 n=1 Tax=Canavalia gladiata TaxID=3824 RepID=A0AAN9R563_CANGL